MKNNTGRLGYTLRLIRIANDLSIKDLAQKMETSSSYISEIENGKKYPSLKTLEKFSETLDVKVSTILLLDEEGEKMGYNYQKLLIKILKTIGEK